jgi:hypothetical protein
MTAMARSLSSLGNTSLVQPMESQIYSAGTAVASRLASQGGLSLKQQLALENKEKRDQQRRKAKEIKEREKQNRKRQATG